MRTFTGYTSRSSLGILADDPESPEYNRPGRTSPAGKKTGGFTPSLPEREFHGEEGRTRGRFRFPSVSLPVLLIACALNLLLLFGFAFLVDRDIASLPKPIYYIYLTDSPDGAPDKTPPPAENGPAPAPSSAPADPGQAEN